MTDEEIDTAAALAEARDEIARLRDRVDTLNAERQPFRVIVDEMIERGVLVSAPEMAPVEVHDAKMNVFASLVRLAETLGFRRPEPLAELVIKTGPLADNTTRVKLGGAVHIAHVTDVSQRGTGYEISLLARPESMLIAATGAEETLDAIFGIRRLPEGYLRALETFQAAVEEVIASDTHDAQAREIDDAFTACRSCAGRNGRHGSGCYAASRAGSAT